ncbi:MAG TPA: lytic murein transglycosylase B [Paenalcaligenes hominis]|uniref:Lytic murein transglycosylase B n=1 Tax=Paenalcaligenes hominis TaxID=643674 RepID=A0A9D2VG00_9BURK|nr:lytic murein transglycosylase B [Paenalcaligenes hominis]
MFRKTRLVQACFCSLLIMGCATSQTNNPQSNHHVPVGGATPSALTLNKEAHPKSGSSVQGRQDYFQADGSLSPYLYEWAQELTQLQGIPFTRIEALLKTAHYNAKAAQLMAPNKGQIKRSWNTYKNRFIEPIRIKAGLDFWNQHAEILQRTAQEYGVPPEILVSIIGVETIYGRYTGDFRVLDALLTLGFSYPDNSRPERGKLFRDQLADLIVLDYQGKIDANTITGSFAGAVGLPQFMPGSLMRYAVDADHDGKIDLFHSMPDILASVANFLIEHGWQPGLPVFAPVQLNDQKAKRFVDGGLIPQSNWEGLLQAQAVQAPNSRAVAAWMSKPLGVINLIEESRGTAEYRLATPNFYAITSYNRSYFYASTVSDFADLLARRRAQ